SVDRRDLPSFPTRRSSDLVALNCSEHRFAKEEACGTERSLWPLVESPPLARCDRLKVGAGAKRPARTRQNGDAGGVVLLVVLKRSEEHTSELQSPYDLVCR